MTGRWLAVAIDCILLGGIASLCLLINSDFKRRSGNGSGHE